MSENSTHRLAKKKAAGFGGKTECSLPGNKRLDVNNTNRRRDTEIERSGLPNRLVAATQRLKKSRTSQKPNTGPTKRHAKCSQNQVQGRNILLKREWETCSLAN